MPGRRARKATFFAADVVAVAADGAHRRQRRHVLRMRRLLQVLVGRAVDGSSRVGRLPIHRVRVLPTSRPRPHDRHVLPRRRLVVHDEHKSTAVLVAATVQLDTRIANARECAWNTCTCSWKFRLNHDGQTDHCKCICFNLCVRLGARVDCTFHNVPL